MKRVALVLIAACAVVSRLSAAAPHRPAPASAADLVGTWQVKMVAHRSTCEETSAGEAKAETWNVSSSKGNLHVVVVGGDTMTAAYSGQIDGDGSVIFAGQGGKMATAFIELHGDTDSLTGHRTVAARGGDGFCVMVYELTATKAH